MSAVWLRAWSEQRRRWRATIGLIVLVGVGGGIALAAFTGARRSEDALPHFLDSWKVHDAAIFVPPAAAR